MKLLGVSCLILTGAISIQEFSRPGVPHGEFRTPIDSLPYVIDHPGSYYLTRDLYTGRGRNGMVLGRGENGIELKASNVTVDLNGFTMHGVHKGAAFWGGSLLRNIVIKNGTIRGWSNASSFRCNSLRVKSVRFEDNGDNVSVSGIGSIVHRVSVEGGDMGIEARSGLVLDNVISGTQRAIHGSDGSLVLRNRCHGNDDGIHSASNSVIRMNEISGGVMGIGISRESGGALIAENRIENCSDEGIRDDNGFNWIRDNFILGCGTGIRVTEQQRYSFVDGNLIADCNLAILAPVGRHRIAKNRLHRNSADFDLGSGSDVAPVEFAATAVSPWANLKN